VDRRIEPTWITGKPERALVHKWRAAEQAILVGAGTVRADDPKLNVREWTGRDPLRLILSGSGSFGKESSVNKTNGTVVVFSENINADLPDALKVKLNDTIPASLQISQYLFNSGIQSLLIEGGAMVLAHFISNRYWDEARIFTGKQYFREGVRAPELNGTLFSRSNFSGSLLEIYLNAASQDGRLLYI